MRLYDAVNNVLKRLDDYPSVSSEQVWTRSEVELYVKDGYDAFCRQTKCILDFFYPENIPQAGNYVARWERGYFDSGMIAVGLLNFSGGQWERDYAEASDTGPINSTQPWEAEYLTTTFPVSLHPVPEDNVAVDRATHDFGQLEPEFTRWVEENDRSFQTTTGEPSRFLMDRDGMSRLRVVPAGSGNATSVGVRGPSDSLEAFWSLRESSGERADLCEDYPLSEVGTVGGANGVGATTASDFTAGYLNNATGPLLTQDFTISLWFKVTSDSDGSLNLLYSGNLGVSTQVSIALLSSRFYAEVGTWSVARAAWPATNYIDDAWHHAIVWVDTATDLYVHCSVDGGATTDSALPISGTHTPFACPVLIGYGDGNSAPGGLYIQRVAWWNRALTTAERAARWNGGAGMDETLPSWGGYGLLRSTRNTDGLGTWSPDGTRGILREIPEHFPMGAPFGIPRRLYSDEANTRVEYFRLGKDLDENQVEVPDRFAKYVEFYAQSKALEREGPGQDMKLSQHFMGRFNEGVDRMVKRLSENKRSRVSAIGSPGKGPVRPALARLPYRYGHATRRGY